MNNLNTEEKIIFKKIVDKLINYLDISEIFNLIDLTYENSKLNKTINKTNYRKREIKDSLIICDGTEDLDEQMLKNNTVIRLFDNDGFYIDCKNPNARMSLHGKCFDYKKGETDNFKVLAIINVYNEADVIKQTIEHLLKEGIDVYIIDNWSKDNTKEIVSDLINIYSGRVFYERFPADNDNNCYEWRKQLIRVEEISKSLDYDWYIHHDADECHISPWKSVSLKEMIYMADKLGFNVIENSVINFRLTSKDQENIFMKDTYFEFGKKEGHFVQLKTWKKDSNINLNNSGGHVAQIPNTKIYPLKILNKHYPFRTLKQANRKVYSDRLPRFIENEKNIGWHTQYNSFIDDNDIICSDLSNLILWDETTFNRYYVKLFLDARF